MQLLLVNYYTFNQIFDRKATGKTKVADWHRKYLNIWWPHIHYNIIYMGQIYFLNFIYRKSSLGPNKGILPLMEKLITDGHTQYDVQMSQSLKWSVTN